VALSAALLVACSGDAPTSPSASTRLSGASGGTATALNAPPSLKLKTVPAVDRTGAVATITGVAPLSVHLNLCPSDDPDQVILPDGSQSPAGDTLNWQFNFGDPARYTIGPTGIPSPDPAFDPATGRFRPDSEHFCRAAHVYEEEGIYIATVSVTDEHLEDQGAGILARRTERVRVVALGEPSADCIPPTVATISSPPGCSGTHATAGFFTGSGLTYSLTGCLSATGRLGSAVAVSIAIDPSTGVITFVGPSCRRVVATNACGSATSNDVEFCSR